MIGRLAAPVACVAVIVVMAEAAIAFLGPAGGAVVVFPCRGIMRAGQFPLVAGFTEIRLMAYGAGFHVFD